MIEATIATSIMAILIALIIVGFYFLGIKTWFEYNAHEYLLCREYQQTESCDSKFKTKMTTMLRWGKIKTLQPYREENKMSVKSNYKNKKIAPNLTTTTQNVKLRLEFEIWHSKKIYWLLEKQIHFPLTAR